MNIFFLAPQCWRRFAALDDNTSARNCAGMTPKCLGIVCGAKQFLQRKHVFFYPCTLLGLWEHGIEIDYIDTPYPTKRVTIKFNEVAIDKR